MYNRGHCKLNTNLQSYIKSTRIPSHPSFTPEYLHNSVCVRFNKMLPEVYKAFLGVDAEKLIICNYHRLFVNFKVGPVTNVAHQEKTVIFLQDIKLL